MGEAKDLVKQCARVSRENNVAADRLLRSRVNVAARKYLVVLL
jgi:hypothetical protein